MRRRPVPIARPIARLLAASCLVTALVACSSGAKTSRPARDADPTTAEPSPTEPTRTEPSTTEETVAPDPPAVDVEAALLGADDFPGGWVDVTADLEGSSSRGFCGQPPITAQYPDAPVAMVAYAEDPQAGPVVFERLGDFGADAPDAFATLQAQATSCTEVTNEGLTATVRPFATSGLGEESFGVQLVTQGATADVVVVRAGGVVVQVGVINGPDLWEQWTSIALGELEAALGS